MEKSFMVLDDIVDDVQKLKKSFLNGRHYSLPIIFSITKAQGADSRDLETINHGSKRIDECIVCRCVRSVRQGE